MIEDVELRSVLIAILKRLDDDSRRIKKLEDDISYIRNKNDERKNILIVLEELEKRLGKIEDDIISIRLRQKGYGSLSTDDSVTIKDDSKTIKFS